MHKLNILIIIVLISISGCRRNRLKVDISSINVKIKLERLDQDLFNITLDNHDSILPWLESRYGNFFTLYNKNVIALGDPDDPSYPLYLQLFVKDTIRINTRNKIDSIFQNLQWLEKKLELAFRYYRYHFPDKTVPNVYTMISGFNQSMVTTSDALGISLDNYLGAECTFYKMLGLPEYKKMNMIPEKIPSDAMYAWALSELEPTEDLNLLAAMIKQGKLMYFLDAVFPDEHDHIKIGYKPDKIEWCEDHESSMWTYFVEHKLLFDNDRMNIRRFTGPGPFTSSFSSESPGKAGVWIGWQIVRKYMRKNPETTLSALMKENDYQKILNESGYDPE